MTILSRFARLLERSHTAGTDVDPNSDAVHGEPLALDIGTKVTVRAALGEAHVLAERLRLSAPVTFPGHGGSPFESETIVRRSGVLLACAYAGAPSSGIDGSTMRRRLKGVKAASSAGRRHSKPLS